MSDVSQAAGYLKHYTHYKNILSNTDTGTIYRGMLENLLRKDLFQTYLKIINFEGLAGHEFYNYMFLLSEVSEILKCIRGINAKSSEHISNVQIFYNPYSLIDYIGLTKVTSFSGLLELLKKTPYYNILCGIEPDKNGRVDYSECEYRIRTYYLNRLLRAVRFQKEDSEILKSLITSDTDLINVINLYRMISFFRTDEKTAVQNMLPFWGRLNKNKLAEIYSDGNMREFLLRFSKTFYGRQMETLGIGEDNLELSIQKLRFIQTKRAFSKSQTAPLCVYSFMSLRETEVHNLIKIIEAIRYKIPAPQIDSLIII